MSSIIPLAIPRSATTTIRIRDFTIPKDTIVFVNLWSVHHDPKAWKDPDVFNPKRFLDGQGLLIDPTFLGAGVSAILGGSPKVHWRSSCHEINPCFPRSAAPQIPFYTRRFANRLPRNRSSRPISGFTLMPPTFYMKTEERN